MSVSDERKNLIRAALDGKDIQRYYQRHSEKKGEWVTILKLSDCVSQLAYAHSTTQFRIKPEFDVRWFRLYGIGCISPDAWANRPDGTVNYQTGLLRVEYLDGIPVSVSLEKS